jgi:predicted enzyme related to lactoylglutathione lyase
MTFLPPGQVVWFEIGTTDRQTATGFYRAAFGWRFGLLAQPTKQAAG